MVDPDDYHPVEQKNLLTHTNFSRRPTNMKKSHSIPAGVLKKSPLDHGKKALSLPLLSSIVYFQVETV